MITERRPIAARTLYGRKAPGFSRSRGPEGGTTTLQALLSAHQQVFLPAGKEVHYFSLHYERGAHWYGEQFADAVPSQCCGEITPYYLFHPEAPRRIQELLPGVRLVLLLRDPVERAVSQYFHSVRLGLEPLSLEQALLAEPERLAGAEAVLDTPGGVTAVIRSTAISAAAAMSSNWSAIYACSGGSSC